MTTLAAPRPAAPEPVFLKDYAPPDFLVDDVELVFDLDDERTAVTSRLAVRRNPAAPAGASLVFDGDDLTLTSLAIDGRALEAGAFQAGERTLTIPGVPDRFTLEIGTRVSPVRNTELSGLYVSGGNYFTQCEAQGFRRITFFPDRPDVMARFTVTLLAEPARCPVLLSNGNPAGRGERDGRAWAKWVDPHPKPSYLFALVAGNLVSVDDRFVTRSGRDVALHIWVRRGDEGRCGHAMLALKKSMKWDEDVFGLEYDLDVFNIAAVSDFNMGAMENKGLNVFNTKYVLAAPETATDADYMGIETVIAHEYFHNWTGNRITCRDWFQLSLKEGLTVFRDQEFSADQGSAAVKRIADVRALRAAQFSEDAGPLAHPVRPESYIAIDNFYTATVYQKGAELVRMIQTIIGRDAFRRGMDLYVERHDNQAVTIEDFVQAMQDASGIDLARFRRWYAQAGTPEVAVSDSFDEASGRYVLTLRQSVAPTPGQPDKQAVPIPVAMGLLDPAGAQVRSAVLLLEDAEQSFTFDGLAARPAPSLLRHFSAPVKLHGIGMPTLRHLAVHDPDPFVRWDSVQAYSTHAALDLAARHHDAAGWECDGGLIEVFSRALADCGRDPAYAALLLSLPGQALIGDQMEVDAVDAVSAARKFLVGGIGRALAPALRATYADLAGRNDAAAPEEAAIGRRALRNVCLGYLVEAEPAWATEAASAQFRDGATMTDVLAALAALCETDGPEREAALAAFHAKWRSDPLVLDKWFAIQAASSRPGTLDRALALASHPDFDLSNPNRVRALVATLAANRPSFHAGGGGGYRFLADMILRIDPRNGQLAARMVPPLGKWRRFDPARQALMKAELQRVLAAPELSRGTFEMVQRSLA